MSINRVKQFIEDYKATQTTKGDERMSKLNLYLNAFRNVVNARMQDKTNRRYLKQNALYGVRLINLLPKPLEYEEIRNRSSRKGIFT